ncbi:MAG: hypothetical protein AAGB14_07960 [Verrucomicrobiota bacterium]
MDLGAVAKHRRGMRWLTTWMVIVAMVCPVVAEEAEPERKVPGVDAVIAEKLTDLPAPEKPQVGKGVVVAITTSDPTVQDDVRNGLACIHAGWDFEGYRHFCEALKKDPNCLMAHFGVLLSLFQADQSMADEKQAALDRMLALIEEDVGTEVEKRYVFGLVKMLRDGPGEAASAFTAIVEDFPNDPQAVLLKSLFGRGGYDDLGDATPDQQRAEEELRAVVEKHDDVPYLLYGLLAIKAESPTLVLKPDLPLARKLVEMAPNFAPYQHLLGHYEWRSGNHTRAYAAFGRAVDLYAEWMDQCGLTPTSCPGWTKAECYRAVALASKGEYETALAVAEGVNRIEIPEDEITTVGGRMLLWEGKTLLARILMKRSAAGDIDRALKSLPSIEEGKRFGGKSLAVWSYQAHQSVLAGRKALDEGSVEDARLISENISELGGRFVQTREYAAAVGERSPWLRSFKAMEVMASELRGLIVMAGPADDIGSAFNWFRSAVDRQKLATLMMPPAVLLPMEVRLGEYYMERRDWQKAIETMIGGQQNWPNDWELLNLLQVTFGKAGMEADAADVEKRIKELSGK